MRLDTVQVQRRHACSTSPARDIGKNRVPALTVGSACSRSSKPVTTPNSPPPREGPEHIRLMIMVDDSRYAIGSDDLEP
jgi:hypothetical protein